MAALSRSASLGRGRRVFYGWWIVLSLGILNLISAGFFFYGLGTFFLPLTNEFGWTYALTSSAFSLHQLEGALISPLAGYGLDRLGPRKIVALGTVLAALGFLILSRADSFPAFALAVAVMAAGFHSGYGFVGQTTVASWFSRRRTTALGLLMAGAGAGGLVVPLVAWVIETQGWRTAALFVGLAILVVGLPTCLVLRHRPESCGLLPDGDAPCPAPDDVEKRETRSLPTGAVDVVQADWGVRQALRSRAFWLLSVASGIAFISQSAMMVHIIPRLSSAGLPATIAAGALSGLMIASIAGRIGFGWLGDRMQKRHVMILLLGMQVVGLCVFAVLSEPWHVFLFLALYAPCYGGAIPLRPSMLAEYVGRRSLGAIQGLFGTFIALGGMIGPFLAGWMFDLLGSYNLSFWILAAITASAVPLIIALPRPAALAPRRQPA